MKAELEAMKAQQVKQKKQKDALMDKIKEQKEHAEDYKVSLEEEKENLAAQENAIQKAIELENSRLAELEAARQRAKAAANQAVVHRLQLRLFLFHQVPLHAQQQVL